MQQQHIMRSFIDQAMQFDVATRLQRGVVKAMCRRHAGQAIADCRPVRLCRAYRGQARGVCFDRAAEFEVIRSGALIVGEQFGQRIDQRTEKARHHGAGFVGDEQSLFFQQRQRLAQGRARHTERFRQIALWQ
ncbi:hypothetical protein GALL_538450 [mine drainage metagenome]|uniref:Uncharacterized protein n=1 Tax=mine drainage metagenome TaxID=410659 RepID=A0A1J5PAW7_9ZZZZ